MNRHLAALDALIEAKHLLKHPFYQAWNRGELTRGALQDYARQYYHHVAAFPTYLSAVHAGSDDQAVRRLILQNLVDEEAGSPNHPDLWLEFAQGAGVGPEEARGAALWPETRSLIESFRQVCRTGSTAAGVAALYAYESQIPAVSESKIEGLCRHYGIDAPGPLAYFRVHIEADREHAAAERHLLERLVDDSSGGEALESADRVLDALNGFLTCVCLRHGIAC